MGTSYADHVDGRNWEAAAGNVDGGMGRLPPSMSTVGMAIKRGFGRKEPTMLTVGSEGLPPSMLTVAGSGG